ncbi:MAG: polyprenyl synthetase family protein [Alphaproteobacteria bacterium]|nr:polyprenyl synthetase family protein [Alphaproteobacteria bacterium]
MTVEERIERVLKDAVRRTRRASAPETLSEAISYSVFPGGGRMRPRLCVAVAEACGGKEPKVCDAAAASLELLHCASLVHDDLPCFDDAAIRRGKPSVHRAFSEPIAVLTGDAMIVLAFETLCEGAAHVPARLPGLIRIVGRAVGAPAGIIAGQAWESEPTINLSAYQRAKTGALFIAAVEAGAFSANSDPESWTQVGEKLGEAYQVADDLHDAMSTGDELGKPVGQDARHRRPNAVKELGVTDCISRLKGLLGEAISAVPPCTGRAELVLMIEQETRRFIPRRLAACAA